MRITSELLEKYGFSDFTLESFNAMYPNGVELIDFLKSGCSIEYLHFVRKYFSLSEEEIKVYLSACKISEDSKDIWECEDIIHSLDIAYSKKVSNSHHIRNSKNITSSSYVSHCEDIDTSIDVFGSKRVKNSHLIGKSFDINRANNILDSNNIINSDNITHSSMVQSSQFIYNSQEITNCYFCGFMNNCKHCIFCVGLTDAEYYVFNKKVTRVQFEQIKEDLILMLSAETCDQFMGRAKSEYFSIRDFYFSNRFDSIFRGLSSEFIDWVKSLPEYNEDIFFQIFLNSEILKNS